MYSCVGFVEFYQWLGLMKLYPSVVHETNEILQPFARA